MASAAPLASLLNIYIVTFNCACSLIDVDAFAAHLFRPYTSRNGPQHPDILVFALEELAPIAYSFLGGTFLNPYYARFVQAVQHASGPSVKYRHLATRNAGMTAILIFVKSTITPHIEWLETAEVGVGKWEMGNKGAAGARIGYVADGDDAATPLTFVAAHLAAMEDGFERRNMDWENIVRGLAFTRSHRGKGTFEDVNDEDGTGEAEPLIAKPDVSRLSMFSPGSPVFFAGDLNYRSNDKGPATGENSTFPQPTADRNDAKHYSQLFKHEQLGREMKAGKTMQLLSESKIDFPPTYKYSVEQQTQASKAIYTEDPEPSNWLWSDHRWPSWTDRILYSTPLSASKKAFNVIEYGTLPIQPTSDHRPVFLAFQLDPVLVKSIIPDYSPPFPLNPQWEQQRAAARRLELTIGVLSYLSRTWEGNGIVAATVIGAVGGWLIMQSLVGA